jgi:DNA end-binding protein Ku
MRPLWSGALNFGLINIPVKLYSAAQERPLNFDLLEKDSLCPIKYARVCQDTGKEVKYQDIVKGYEYRKGDYVVLMDEDFKKAKTKKTDTIDIVSFTKIENIDPIYFDKPYYVEPDKKAAKAYLLLREALKRSKKAGVAKFVLRDREYVGIVQAKGDAIVLDRLRFDDEIRPSEDLALPKGKQFDKKQVDIALTLIDQLTEPFKPEKYKDKYTQELKRVISQKAKGKKPTKAKTSAEEPKGEVFDLMAALKASLQKEHVKSR